jgi:membrane fusion protein
MSQLFRREVLEHAVKRLEGRVILALPTQWYVYTALILISLVAGSIFLVTGTYTRSENVTGWLVPQGGLIHVATRSSGTLTKLLVKEGDSVTAGQPIARVHLASVLASGEGAGAAARRALSSETTAIAAQRSAEEKKLADESVALGPKLSSLARQIVQARHQVALQEQQVRLAELDVQRFIRLADTGAIAPRQVDDRRSNLVTQQQSLARLRSDLQAMAQQAADVVARQRAIPADLAQARAGEALARAQVAQKEVQTSVEDSDVVVASVGGRVLALPADVGQTLAAGATIATIELKNSRLEAELYVPSSAVGFVRAGESVRLKYQAFPHEKFGTADAAIVSVSRTILSPADVALPGSGIQQPVFRVHASLASQAMKAYGQTVPLQPGMLLTADIVLERRNLLEWLFDPIYAAAK